jgi:PAS domain S-box-containing protein
MYRILYVDDEPGLLEIGKLFLEQSGQLMVETSLSAPDALTQLNTKTYDAVISDYQMPEMNGIQFLRKVRLSGNTIPFILFTGRGREEVVIQALNEGANFYLQKGGDPLPQFTELEHQVRQAIQQRRAEASIHDLEQREADIINFLPDATVVIDTNGVVIAWNRAIEEMTGVPAAEILGKGDYEYALPFYGKRQPILLNLVFESDEEIAKNYTHVTHKKDILIADTSLPRLKGKAVTLMGIASPLYDRQGRIAGAIESIRDITDRKQAEDAIKESEEKYRNLVENVVDVVYRADSGGMVIFITPSILPLTGYDSVSEIIGHPIASFWEHPEKRSTMLERMKQTGYVKDYEVVIKKRDGTGIPVSISSHFYHDTNGRIAGVEGIIRDISDRKKAEEKLTESEGRFAAFMEHLPVTAFIKDEKSTNLFVNRHMTEIFGEHDWIGKSVYEQFPEEAAAKMVADDQLTIREGYRKNTEYLVDKTGNRRIFETHKFRIDRTDKPPLIGGFAVDITERKMREQELQENEQRLISIYNTVEDSIFQLAVVFGGQFRFSSVNAAFYRATGLTPGQVIGRMVNEVIPEPSLSLVLEKYRQAAETKTIVRWEETSDYPAGRVTGDVSISPIVDSAGTCISLIGSVHDITGRKRMEEALREREERYRLLTECMKDVVWQMDASMTFTYVSPSVLQQCGYTPEEVVGKRLSDFITPASEKEVRARMAERKEQEGGGFYRGSSIYLLEQVCRDGTTLMTEVVTNPVFDAQDHFTGWRGISRDITERRRAEEALRTSETGFRDFFNNTGDAITIHDLQGRFLVVNDEICRRLGYSREELLKMSPADIDEPEYGEKVRDRIATLQQTGRLVFETVHRRKDGTRIPTEVSSRLITYHGKPAIISTGRDITGRKLVEDSLRRANNRLSLLSAVTRHDITNQLMLVQGWTSLMEKNRPDRESAEYLRKITSSLEKISAMIRFIREYESIGFSPPVWQDCTSLIDTAGNQASSGKVTVKNTIPGGVEVFADPLIARVFYNLTDNAVRHGGKITTVCFSAKESADELLITCEDDGDGIPADEKERIFERGFGKNTGMGLFLVREILLITGITIAETGIPGTGARFEICVPGGAWRHSDTQE